jgi:hypothetical protein
MSLFSSIVKVLLAVLVVITSGLFTAIVVRRLVIERLEKKFDAKYREAEVLLLDGLRRPGFEGAEALADRYRNSPRVLTELLVSYARSMWGSERDKLTAVFDRALRGRFLADLSSRRVYRRLRAARLVGFFADRDNAAVVRSLLRDPPIVRLAAANAISAAPGEATVPLVFRAFESDDEANIHAYKNVFFGLGLRAEPGIRRALRLPLGPAKIGVLIEIVGAIPLRSLGGDIVAFADHPDKEIRLRAARAFGGLLDPETLPILIRLARDEAWEVQAQAIRSLGRLGGAGAIDIAGEALFSRNWHVRMNAREALLNLGDEGLERLVKVARQTGDRYAAEMAAMGLEDARIAGGGKW